MKFVYKTTIKPGLSRVDTFLQQLINGLSLGAIYALIALGYTMVYGVLRLINFAHGDVYMLGAFAGYYLANALNLDANPSLLGAIVVTIGAMARLRRSSASSSSGSPTGRCGIIRA